MSTGWPVCLATRSVTLPSVQRPIPDLPWLLITIMLAGRLHDAEHEIEAMLAGSADPTLTMAQLHLTLALDELKAPDTVAAQHHVGHFVEHADPEMKAHGEEIVELLWTGEHHEAEHEMEELLELLSK